ncbi:MAG TPA: methyltransferase domain-containing protein [Kiritimatiellia bacterium]|nr:methyltransferase domain-containing protein [Kiritimatiellia bacterium]
MNRLISLGITFPFSDETFDGVVGSQVLEHVFNPSVFLSEVARVLKSHGHLLLTVPFVWDEHEQPYDYARYSSFGLKHLLEEHGLQVEAQQKTMHDLRAVIQIINMYIYKGSARLRKTRIGTLLATLLLNAPFNVLGSLLWRVFPSSPDLYLDSVVLARKMSSE